MRFPSSQTPLIVKRLIYVIVSVSLLSPLLTALFHQLFHISGPQEWLALSYPGVTRGWVWQPLTYFLIQSTSTSISLGLLITIFFRMLLLWFASGEIALRYGTKGLLSLFVGGGLFAGLVSLFFMALSKSPFVLVGSFAPIYGLLTVWTMLFPDLELFFFFVIRMKARWLIVIFLGFSLLQSLSNEQWILFSNELAGVLWGYLFGLIVWKQKSPFKATHKFDEWVHRLRLSPRPKAKTYDFHSGEEISDDDERFMDQMLAKISRFGPGSLTRKEQARMDALSRKR